MPREPGPGKRRSILQLHRMHSWFRRCVRQKQPYHRHRPGWSRPRLAHRHLRSIRSRPHRHPRSIRRRSLHCRPLHCRPLRRRARSIRCRPLHRQSRSIRCRPLRRQSHSIRCRLLRHPRSIGCCPMNRPPRSIRRRPLRRQSRRRQRWYRPNRAARPNQTWMHRARQHLSLLSPLRRRSNTPRPARPASDHGSREQQKALRS